MEATGLCKCGKCGAAKAADEMSKNGKTCKACFAERFAKKNASSEEVVVAEKRPIKGQSRATERKKRVPMTHKDVLVYEHMDPNYIYYNPLDKAGRIERLEIAGWEVVVDPNARGCTPNTATSRLPGSAVTMPGGNGETHVLMRKPVDDYTEDMAPVYDRANEVEADIFRQREKSDFYEPKAVRTKVSSNTVRVATEQE